MSNIVNIQTMDELLKIMGKQKAITNKAVRELHTEMDSTNFIYKADRTLSEGTSQEITRRIHALLFKYASMPTLSEFSKNTALEGGWVWGGSFGVAAIVGSVFLKSWSEIFPEFSKTVKSVMLKVLEEQAHQTEDKDPTPMIDRIIPGMRFVIRDQNGIEILGQDRDKMIYDRVAGLLQLMAQVLVVYGLLEIDEETEKEEEPGQIAAKLTPLGSRVFLHLNDVELYVTEISELYPTLKQKLTVESK